MIAVDAHPMLLLRTARPPAWEAWQAHFHQVRPALLRSLEGAPESELVEIGREVGQELLRQAQSLPPLPRSVGYRGLPHAARLVRWAAVQLADAPRMFRRGINIVAFEQTVGSLRIPG